MIEFNPYWTYYLASVLWRLNDLNAGDSLTSALAELGEVRGEIKKFLDADQHRLFPDTCKQASEIVKKIDVLLNNAVPGKKLETGDINPLIDDVSEVSKNFFRESNRVHLYALERQKVLDLYILIESLGDAFSERAKIHLSDMSIREIKESGKCLAFERYTASGFHMLRAVESEIRDYIVLLLRDLPKKRDWGYYIEILKSNDADPKLVNMLDSMRNLDRNPLMHPEDFLEQVDAINLFWSGIAAVERLLADMDKKRLLRDDLSMEILTTSTT